MTMTQIAGVRVKRQPQILYYDASNFHDLHVNEFVIVDTDKCREAARIVATPGQIKNAPNGNPLRPILRRATPLDLSQWQQLRLHENEALAQCKALVEKHHLPMRLLSAEYNFDGSHITFYFTAEGRVDFRGLVKDLASMFTARVELWQIGPRDRARLIGGLAPCGQELCCEKFLPDYPKSSIKMAKDQDLPLGPNAAAGICGRPMCCLSFEQNAYQEAKTKVPRLGATTECERGQGKVIARNVLKENVTVQFGDGTNATLGAAEVKQIGRPDNNDDDDD